MLPSQLPCPALSGAAPVLMETLPQGAPSSGITYTVKPGPLTCEAAGLAGAHGAEQRQQGQPEGPEHGRAAVAALGLS